MHRDIRLLEKSHIFTDKQITGLFFSTKNTENAFHLDILYF